MQWEDKYVQFTKGLNLGSSDLLNDTDLVESINLDTDEDGAFKGRPGRAAPTAFQGFGGTFASTGYTANGIHRVRDVNGERPFLTANGHAFSLEDAGQGWSNKGNFGCFRVDRPVNFLPSSGGTIRPATAQTFGPNWQVGNQESFSMLSSTFMQTGLSGGPGLSASHMRGTGARCGTTNAIATFESIGTKLVFSYSPLNSGGVTNVVIANNAVVSTAPAYCVPVICSSFDATSFFIIYATSATTYSVLQVSPTGTVTATYNGTQTGLNGFWIDNTTIAGNKVVLAITHTGGLVTKVLNATTLVDLALDSAYAIATGGLEVAIGCTSTTSAQWIVKEGSTGDGDLTIGTSSLTTGSTAVTWSHFYGGGTLPNAGVHHGICHQPIVCGGQVLLSVVSSPVSGSSTGTWLTLNTSNPGAPFIVARGPSNATVPTSLANTAILLPDGSGFTFPTIDWSRFSNTALSLVGLDALYGLNRVTLSNPRTALVGDATVFSGSVPRIVQHANVTELGFPYLAAQPAFDVSVNPGGSIGIGSYTLAAVWRWTDEAGNIHRSAPSPFRTVATTSGNNTLICTVPAPIATEKGLAAFLSPVYCEIYCTDVNPVASDPHYLVASSHSPSLGFYSFTLTTQPVTTSEQLYTDGGAFAQYHVAADGGVAVLGRRVWMASGSTAYASKVGVVGQFQGFNDEGQLQVNLPPGAGRILSLESMDDKLVMFCTKGIFVVGDGGPDNAGNGPDFGPPQRITDLGIAHPQSTCLVDGKGVLFAVAPNTNDPQKGGPWLLDRGGGLTFIGKPFLGYLATDAPSKVCYSSQRGAAYITFDRRNASKGTGVLMLDFRDPRWSIWLNQDGIDGALQFVTCVGGNLWSLCTEPAGYTALPGTDAAGAYAMRLQTGNLFVGQTGVGWGRVRSVKAICPVESGAHTLTYTATFDQVRVYTSAGFSAVVATTGTTWPSTRQSLEWRLPTQKGSSFSIEMVATPATAKWAAINLRIAPTSAQAPSSQRQ